MYGGKWNFENKPKHIYNIMRHL